MEGETGKEEEGSEPPATSLATKRGSTNSSTCRFSVRLLYLAGSCHPIKHWQELLNVSSTE